MRTIFQTIVAVFALTVLAPGHAEEVTAPKSGLVKQVVTGARDTLDTLVHVIIDPWINFKVSSKDVDCLAQNIYYESGNEPEEGKAAVGIVTINRVRDNRFGNSICEVVKARTVITRSKDVPETVIVKPAGWFSKEETETRTKTVKNQFSVCQFSWTCQSVKKPKLESNRWEESRRIAHNLLTGEYLPWRIKYSDALYFHATSVRPTWAKQKRTVSKVGGHIFYSDI